MNLPRHSRLLIIGFLLSTTCFNLYPIRRHDYYAISVALGLVSSVSIYTNIIQAATAQNTSLNPTRAVPIALVLGQLFSAFTLWFPWSFVIHSDDYKLECAQQQLETMKIQPLLSTSFHKKEKELLQLVNNNFESHGGQTMALTQALISAEKTKVELFTLTGEIEKIAQANIADIAFHDNCKKTLLTAAECIKNLFANIKLLNDLMASPEA